MKRQKTPKEMGYRFAAEWERQSAVWFAWPVRRSLWPSCFDRVREQLAAIYVLAARFQTVRVLCAKEEQSILRSMMIAHGDSSTVEFYDYQSDDIWIRDYGPIFLKNDTNQELCVSDWRFNAWGNKFPEHLKDNAAAAWIANELGLRTSSSDNVLEGGAVESNGAGFILTTEAVLLNSNRNRDQNIEVIEDQLITGLGADRVLWLRQGLAGDDTDGHVDNLARFFNSEGMLIAAVTNPEDPNFNALTENACRAKEFCSMSGKPFDCVTLPLPAPIDHQGEPLAASYLNFMILNGAVLVPAYGQPIADSKALKIIEGCFPDREIIGVDCTDIIKEGGALHCMSLHQPACI